MPQLLLVERVPTQVADHLTGPSFHLCHSRVRVFDHLVSQQTGDLCETIFCNTLGVPQMYTSAEHASSSTRSAVNVSYSCFTSAVGPQLQTESEVGKRTLFGHKTGVEQHGAAV